MILGLRPAGLILLVSAVMSGVTLAESDRSDAGLFPRSEEVVSKAEWPSAWEAVQQLGPGVNLGNGFEAPVPGSWGVDVDEALVEAARAGGFETIRFPVRFNAHALDEAPYTIDAAFLAQVDAIVEAALERDLTIIVDLHHYDELHADPVGHHDRFLALWHQLATHYADAAPEVWFELLNEPHGKLNDPEVWNPLAAEALAVVRATNPTRMVMIEGGLYAHSTRLSELEVPDDPWVVASFHTYDPFPFTHQGASWVPFSDGWLGTRWERTQAQIDALHRGFDRASAFSERTGVPVVLGEYGAYEAAPYEDRLAWTDAVGCVADQHHVPAIYWELAAGFGMWDVPSATWDTPLRDAVLPPRSQPCDRSVSATTTTTTTTSTTSTTTDTTATTGTTATTDTTVTTGPPTSQKSTGRTPVGRPVVVAPTFAG